VSFLRRLLGGDSEPVPDWAPFDRGRDYRAFLDAVAADLARRGLRFEFGDGVVHVERAGSEEPHQYGLSNLSQLCYANERGDWSRVIASHFTSLLAMEGRDLDALAADYEQVRLILRVRLMPDESMGGVELPESVVQATAPGILAVLVFDFPDSTATVHRDHLAGWPVDVDGAFEAALANLASEPTPVHEDVELDDTQFTVWFSDSFYVATRALRLAALLPDGTTDALVAVPNRHTLLVHPIVDGGALAAMQAMYRLAVQLFREGPGSISDQPYWWHEGTLTQIPHDDQGSTIAVSPPDAFVELLESTLARAAGDPPLS
jgi:hypothetical protein